MYIYLIMYFMNNKTDQSQHETIFQLCLNAGAALILVAITAHAHVQRLALAHPLFTLSMWAY